MIKCRTGFLPGRGCTIEIETWKLSETDVTFDIGLDCDSDKNARM